MCGQKSANAPCTCWLSGQRLELVAVKLSPWEWKNEGLLDLWLVGSRRAQLCCYGCCARPRPSSTQWLVGVPTAIRRLSPGPCCYCPPYPPFSARLNRLLNSNSEQFSSIFLLLVSRFPAGHCRSPTAERVGLPCQHSPAAACLSLYHPLPMPCLHTTITNSSSSQPSIQHPAPNHSSVRQPQQQQPVARA